MEESQLQARIDAVSWYHEFDFGDGLKAVSKAPGIEGIRRIWRFIEEQLLAVDFRDKTVLDIGCWDGYWSFYAERRGAKSVLATDDFTQQWGGKEGLLLAKELLKSRVQVKTLSVYEAASLGQQFDIILFLGVYYHLFDPFHAFAQLRSCCHPGTLICIEGNEGFGLPPNSAVLDPDMSWGKFLPSIGYLRQLLRAAYFSVKSERFHSLGAPQVLLTSWLGWCWRLRMCLEALRGSRGGVANLHSTSAQRVFLLCTPIEGENSAHLYRPPFGLHAFDPRFKRIDAE